MVTFNIFLSVFALKFVKDKNYCMHIQEYASIFITKLCIYHPKARINIHSPILWLGIVISELNYCYVVIKAKLYMLNKCLYNVTQFMSKVSHKRSHLDSYILIINFEMFAYVLMLMTSQYVFSH